MSCREERRFFCPMANHLNADVCMGSADLFNYFLIDLKYAVDTFKYRCSHLDREGRVLARQLFAK